MARALDVLVRKTALAMVLALLLPTAAPAADVVVEYYHLDAAGSVRVVTDRAGSVVERHNYMPFGEEWCRGASCGSLPGQQPKRFTGKERDLETGLDYFGARYYGAGIGRFTTVDPVYTWGENLVDPQRWNRYAYARNAPFRYVDPDGRELRTTELARMQDIAGPAASKIAITNGKLDTSGITASDLQNNEGALLLHQLATSTNVYTYAEGSTIATAAGVQSFNGSAANLNNRPDSRYRHRKGGHKVPAELPPAGIDDAVVINPSIPMYQKANGQPVSTAALAFHELAEGYATVDGGQQYLPMSSGSHATAAARERTLVSQRPGFTLGLAGEELRR